MTPISPELALAMNVAANRGVYALLLGSGVSQSAGILTGWGVTLDLVRKVAAAAGSDAESDPEKWYGEEYRNPPQYSTLLEELAPTTDERRSLLEGYFEPTPEEREEGIKTPTDAHHAIARMVADGWLRVIVTTNFDRLLEVALEEAGVTPVVIATPEAAAGATPLAHSKCTVIKVHGDYMDPGIKNSEEELATYGPATNTLLDQVFDEYGLVVCGWSGEYDAALRGAIDRCKSRRYTTYWCTLGSLGQEAKQLSQSRAARVVEIDGADSFFTELEERVTSIDKAGQQHPMDTRAAVETLKRYLPEDRHRIRLHDFMREATEELVSHLTLEEVSAQENNSAEAVAERFRNFGILSERTVALLATGCYWGRPEQDSVWTDAVRRLVEADPLKGRPVAGEYTLQYPGLLAFYSAGVAAVAAARYEFLASLLLIPVRSVNSPATEPIVQSIIPGRIVAESVAHLLYPHPETPEQRYHQPRSRYLHLTLKPILSDLIPAEADFDEAFDRFEYLAHLVESDLESHKYDYATAGYRWFDRRDSGSWFQPSRIAGTVQRELEAAKEQWPPLNAGLFNGSLDSLVEVKRAVGEATARHNP